MPTLHALVAGSDKARDIMKLSDSEAIKILSAYAWTYTEKPVLLSGERSRLQFYATPERYDVGPESKVDTYEAGYYLLEARATPDALDALLKK